MQSIARDEITYSNKEKIKFIYLLSVIKFLLAWKNASIRFNQSNLGKLFNKAFPYALGLLITIFLTPIKYITSFFSALFSLSIWFSSGVVVIASSFLHYDLSSQVREDFLKIFLLPFSDKNSLYTFFAGLNSDWIDCVNPIEQFVLHPTSRMFIDKNSDKNILFNLDILSKLNPHLTSNYGFRNIYEYALLLAVKHQRRDLLNIFISRKVESRFVFSKKVDGIPWSNEIHSSPLSVAIANKDRNTVNLLLSRSKISNIDTPSREYWKQALYSAVGTDDFALVKLVVNNIEGGAKSVATLVDSIVYNCIIGKGRYSGYEPFIGLNKTVGASRIVKIIGCSLGVPGYEDRQLICQSKTLFDLLRFEYRDGFSFSYNDSDISYQNFKEMLKQFKEGYSKSIETFPDGMNFKAVDYMKAYPNYVYMLFKEYTYSIGLFINDSDDSFHKLKISEIKEFLIYSDDIRRVVRDIIDSSKAYIDVYRLQDLPGDPSDISDDSSNVRATLPEVICARICSFLPSCSDGLIKDALAVRGTLDSEVIVEEQLEVGGFRERK